MLYYKHKNIQDDLAKLIRLPITSFGLKAIVQKVNAGTLAIKEEIAYVEYYHTFKKNILYSMKLVRLINKMAYLFLIYKFKPR